MHDESEPTKPLDLSAISAAVDKMKVDKETEEDEDMALPHVFEVKSYQNHLGECIDHRIYHSGDEASMPPPWLGNFELRTTLPMPQGPHPIEEKVYFSIEAETLEEAFIRFSGRVAETKEACIATLKQRVAAAHKEFREAQRKIQIAPEGSMPGLQNPG